MDLPDQMSLDVTWSLLPLVHAHDLKEEMHHVAQVLARRAGHCRPEMLALLQGLEVEVLSQVLMSDGWVVSFEAELCSLLLNWLKAQPWSETERSMSKQRMSSKPKVKAPPEVYLASAKWGIRWGHLHVQQLAVRPRLLAVCLSEVG